MQIKDAYKRGTLVPCFKSTTILQNDVPPERLSLKAMAFKTLAAVLIIGPFVATPGYSQAQITADASFPSLRKALLDTAGNRRYIVYLNENMVQSENAAGELPAIKVREVKDGADFRSWHQPKTRAMVQNLERDYAIKAISMTSWAMSTMAAHIPDNVIQKLRLDPRVYLIEEVFDEPIPFSAWANQSDGTEMVRWGKIAIGTNDTITTTNPVYVIDGWIEPHNELNFTSLPTLIPKDIAYGYAPSHANHVAGITGERRDSQNGRGINPGAPIINVRRGGTIDQIQVAFDQTLADAEQQGIFAVANLSSSGYLFTVSGGLGHYIKRLSTRLLVVQAAGNGVNNNGAAIDACSAAYEQTNAVDGILVVGGIDSDGRSATNYDNSHVGYGGGNSNYGPCVEAWAPSKLVWSTWYPGSTSWQYLSGTSMAAPHVSALAARFGNNATRPLEREWYIRSKLFNTGFNDLSNRPINVPSYLQPASSVVPQKLPVFTFTTSAGSSGDPVATIDGKYLSGNYWNANNQLGWIQVDLGAIRNVRAVRLVPEQFPPGPSTHQILMGNTGIANTLVATLSGDTATLEPISQELNVSTRYLRINTVANSAWTSWREIEIYGY